MGTTKVVFHGMLSMRHVPQIQMLTCLIRKDIIAAIDDPYSIEQLRDPRMNVSVVRPLVDKYYELDDVSIVANRILRRINEDYSEPQGLLHLAQILVGGFDPFQGAPEQVIRENSHLSWTTRTKISQERKLPALEVAIISQSKTLLSSSACQRVVNAIYEGRVVYTPTSFLDILPDKYKRKPISLYNPRNAPILNQYRLIVPRTRNLLEVFQFIVLLALFIFVMVERDPSTFTVRELFFMVYTVGWILDLFSSVLEHGWHVYTQNLWSFLDVTFASVFSVYLVLRVYGWRLGETEQGQQALDVLAMGAPVLVPRLAFNLMSENMLFLSLRAMMRDFTILTILAVWCFGGFLLSMVWLSNGTHQLITISKWMLWVWFGLDGTGIQRSIEFHWLLGPILMVTFAFLGNTLFLTILVSMLSTTFSTIVANAAAEIQFRRAVLTLEGVKSDAIFAFFPPFNILAVLILLPLKFILTPRWFHKVNVFAVRTLNAPLLLIIGIIERRLLWAGARRQKDAEQLPRSHSRVGLLDFSRGFSAHADIQAVFDAEPPQSVEDQITNEDGSNAFNLSDQFSREFDQEPPKLRRIDSKNRKDSVQPFIGLSQHLRDIINEGSEDGDSTVDVKSRLKTLEESTLRIEQMLGRLCEELDETPKGESVGAEGDTGTMADLDRSGTADLDD
ncbi:hypothetical protein B7494_g464 [Chlorociboria aeruginascens]|nr:hypothetical protein B7494_g464 [Chlorociboria aeruginascens]